VLVDSDPEGVNQAGRAIMEGWDPEACLVEVLETVSQQEVAWRIAKAAQMATEAVLEGKEPPPLVYIKSCDVHGGLAHVEIRYGSRKQRASYVQVWSVLTVLASLCVKEETCTLRGLYYRAKASFPRSARTYEGVSAAVQVVVGLLQVPRPCLGVVAASKGEFFGNLHVRANDAGTGNGGSSSGDDGWIDCRNCVVPIPGDVRQVEAWHLQTDAQLVLVVEKEAVLHRLYRERIHQKVPVIVLTAKGMPDLASRSFLRKLHVEAALPVAAVVDWNPSGVIILHTYAQGGLHRTAMLEASRYSVPDLLWLGVRREHIQTEELKCFGQPLSAKDASLLNSMLRSGCLDSRPGWKKEVIAMQSTGRKVDIEALIDGGGKTVLADLLALRIMQERFA